MKRFFGRVLLLFFFACVMILGYQAAYEVPVLMYHHVDYNPERSSIYVSPETFEQQMEFLKVHRYHVASLDEVMSALKTGKRLPPNTVAITFDDGHLDNIQNAYPVLKKMGFPATIFMITGNIGREDWLSEEDLKIMSDMGIDIGSHTESHKYLPNVRNNEQIDWELVQSKARLEGILGKPVKYFSYPAGGLRSDIEEMTRRAGYEGAVTTNYSARRHDPYALRRIKITESTGGLFSFWLKTSGLYSLSRKKVQAQPITNGYNG